MPTKPKPNSQLGLAKTLCASRYGKDYNDEKYFYSNIVFDSSDLLFTNQYILCKTYSDRHKLFCRSGQ